jgi:hypothetical protein
MFTHYFLQCLIRTLAEEKQEYSRLEVVNVDYQQVQDMLENISKGDMSEVVEVIIRLLPLLYEELGSSDFRDYDPTLLVDVVEFNEVILSSVLVSTVNMKHVKTMLNMLYKRVETVYTLIKVNNLEKEHERAERYRLQLKNLQQ